MHIFVHVLMKFVRLFYVSICLLIRLFFSCRRERVLLQVNSEYNSSILISECGSKRFMRFDSVFNGAQAQLDLKHIDHPDANYIQLMILSIIYYPLDLTESNILILGLGGGTLPRALRRLCPNASITIIEIDPLVVQMAKTYFHFQEDSRMKVWIMDGRTFVNHASNRNLYQMIFFDVYDFNSGLPSHMKTQEFFFQLKNCLHPTGGLLISNLVCIYESYLNVRQTIISVFGQRNFLTYRSNDFVNMVAIASTAIENFPTINEKSDVISEIKLKLAIDVDSLLKRRQEHDWQRNSAGRVYEDRMMMEEKEEEMSLTQFANIV